MARSRTGSRLSFRKSSSSSITKNDLFESPDAKHKPHIKGKADPSKAINEAQPSDVAVTQEVSAALLRDIEHRDTDGNIIVDPDRSNPTRPRLERPLDTIRSFEAAIDGSYNRRQSFRAETPNPSTVQNRRSSYFSGQSSLRRGPSDTTNHHGDRMAHNRPESFYDSTGSPSTPYHGNPNRRFGPRNNSDPALYGNNQTSATQQSFHPAHGHQPSYDTVGTASNGSHMTEAWGNSTDPSSENSSIDRVQPGPKADMGDSYGFGGFGGGPNLHGPISEEHGQGSPLYGHPGYGQSWAAVGNKHPYQGNGIPHNLPQNTGPQPPPKEDVTPRMPIKLGANNPAVKTGAMKAPSPPAETEKRKSWLKKRFSRG